MPSHRARLRPTALALLFLVGACRRMDSDRVGVDERGGKIAPAPNSVIVRGASGPDADREPRGAPDASHADGAAPSSQRGGAGPVWASWPVPSAPATEKAHPQEYDTSHKPVVVDKVTGRMWQRFVEAKTHTWTQARDYCESLDLGGYTDWRLPSRVELVSIVDLTHSQPSINQTAFPKTPSDWFWTSSVDAENPTTAAWYVYFYFGYPKTDTMNNQFRVRCARDATVSDQSDPSRPRYDIQKNVVRDIGTGLTWQRAIAPQSFDFDGARQYCMKLRIGHQGDWRVPSAGELLTLVDERRTNPTIEIAAFPHTPSQSFWTSSSFADTPAMAWHVYFESGNSLYGLLKGLYRVRCVK